MQLSSLALDRRPLLAALLVAAVASCRPPALPFPVSPLAADSAKHEVLDEGLAHHAYRLTTLPAPEPTDTLPGPWMVHVLEADRRQCWQPFPYRHGTDPGRAPLSTLAGAVLRREKRGATVGGVNADFFFFAPNGVLQGPHIRRGDVIAGPGDRAAAALDSAGRLHVVRLTTRGFLAAGGDTLAIGAWNRWMPAGLAWYDGSHGRIDSLRASVVLELAPMVTPAGKRWALWNVDSVPPASLPAASRWPMLVLGRSAPDSLRARVLAFARTHGLRTPLDAFDIAIRPFHPKEAVGGHGILLRGGAIPPAVDSTGAASFAQARHPRTAVGWDSTGRRLLLVTVDGRQPGYSAGMTLRELARTMRALGASEALNLDGGGSTTMVVGVRNGAGQALTRVLNRPSDREQGRIVERPIANALMIARSCPR